MKAADIENLDGLRAWLNDKPREFSVRIAHRIAVRELPNFLGAADESISPLLGFRAILLAGPYVKVGNPDILSAFSSLDHASEFAASSLAADTIQVLAYALKTNFVGAAPNPAPDSRLVHFHPYVANAGAVAHCANRSFEIKRLGTDWEQIKKDAESLERCGEIEIILPENAKSHLISLWNRFVSDRNQVYLARSKLGAESAQKVADYQSFWIPWYERLIAGEPDPNPDLIHDIARIDPTDWVKGDVFINNVKIPELMAKYESKLVDATPVDFTFDALHRVMRMIGLRDDMRHLQEPSVVQSFLRDADEAKEGFQDFSDDASELQGGNFAGVLRKRSDRILNEFTFAKDQTHLRATRIVMLARDLEIMAQDQKAQEDLGDTLYSMLLMRIDMLKVLCRRHFGPAYLTLAPLAQLEFEHVDQSQVISIFKQAISHLKSLPTDDLVALDAEGMAVFEAMLVDLCDYSASISSATSEEFRSILSERFAQNSASMGLSLGRLYERSSHAAGNISRKADAAIKAHQRVENLTDILESVRETFPGS